MRTDLLLRLADLLEADANNPEGIKFDLDDWGHSANDEMPFTSEMTVIPANCNTAACAMGLAAISGAFADEGLTWKLDMYFDGSLILFPECEGLAGFGAVMALFGINMADAEFLFSSDKYSVTKGAEAELAVAQRIRELVAEHNE